MIEAAIVLLGAFAGGFVSGLACFGTGLVALGVWLYAIDPQTAASLVVICSIIAQAQTIPTIWHTVRPARVGPLVLGGLVGVPIGTALLSDVNPDVFRLGVGILLLAFSSVMLWGPSHRPILWGGTAADAVVGLGGGVLGGLAGLSGPLPTMWRPCGLGARTSGAPCSRLSI